MPKKDWIENTVEKIFQKENLYPTGKIKTVLDVACGLSLKSQYIDASVRVGLDIYRPFLEKINSKVGYIPINADCMDLDKLFLSNSFDLVLLLDIVEHLKKEKALKLINMAESIAKVAVIIETPNGYIPQNIDIWGQGGDDYQTHRSSWAPEEFSIRGYNVVLREYTMSNVRRHSDIDVDHHIIFIDAIKRFDI